MAAPHSRDVIPLYKNRAEREGEADENRRPGREMSKKDAESAAVRLNR